MKASDPFLVSNREARSAASEKKVRMNGEAGRVARKTSIAPRRKWNRWKGVVAPVLSSAEVSSSPSKSGSSSRFASSMEPHCTLYRR